jgi:hypothetical protein
MFTTGHPDDDARLEVLAEDGGLSRPHSWSHVLWFATEEAAQEAVDRLAVSFTTRKVEHPTDPGWLVQALREEVLITQEAVVAARSDLSALAQHLGGRYDGWLAWT